MRGAFPCEVDKSLCLPAGCGRVVVACRPAPARAPHPDRRVAGGGGDSRRARAKRRRPRARRARPACAAPERLYSRRSPTTARRATAARATAACTCGWSPSGEFGLGGAAARPLPPRAPPRAPPHPRPLPLAPRADNFKAHAPPRAGHAAPLRRRHGERLVAAAAPAPRAEPAAAAPVAATHGPPDTNERERERTLSADCVRTLSVRKLTVPEHSLTAPSAHTTRPLAAARRGILLRGRSPLGRRPAEDVRPRRRSTSRARRDGASERRPARRRRRFRLLRRPAAEEGRGFRARALSAVVGAGTAACRWRESVGGAPRRKVSRTSLTRPSRRRSRMRARAPRRPAAPPPTTTTAAVTTTTTTAVRRIRCTENEATHA